MSRIACLRIPRFQIVVHQKLEPALKGEPWVLIATKGKSCSPESASARAINVGRARVFMCSKQAAEKDIYPGMRLSEARASCADLIWRATDDRLYYQARKEMLEQLLSFSPRVSAQQAGIFF